LVDSFEVSIGNNIRGLEAALAIIAFGILALQLFLHAFIADVVLAV
jgi:hypothetical protein